MVWEHTGQLIPTRDVDEWLNIVMSKVCFYLTVKADMLKDKINTLLVAEAAVTPTFNPFLPLAQQCDTMIQEATLHSPTHFTADPFIAVIKQFLPLSKTSKLDLMLKTNLTNTGCQIAMMMPGPHGKRLNDLDRLKTAAMTALGHHVPPDMLVEPAVPKVMQKRKLESAELETNKEAPLTIVFKGSVQSGFLP
ncbi:uncharacterized protein LACBIDRAFT_301909 [Laccaria bicolor S238N-H82]|uniref:Predicted protein n=1 Tax=Laccaria bicolor (strain S238N-H82 / ATCC MYA-4686) TaxID=486041 RepID=B0CPW4_LACBS|nr:uncharacterized protein LACBIDRAFT_301909 [Laccaria bicolor S238N-H82]EDR16135.1 predicted protein [Laccaria bicolor S238N-H82]|eukprot:XP_001874343.1 predicted protein [Laccaria bicolor S238N-H82]